MSERARRDRLVPHPGARAGRGDARDVRPAPVRRPLRDPGRPHRAAGARRRHLRGLLGVRARAPRRRGRGARRRLASRSSTGRRGCARRPTAAAARASSSRARRSAARSSGSGCSVYEATPEALGGSFDLVFCGSVLIHLRDPMLALERLAALCRGRLILADEYSRRLAWLPLRGGRVSRRDARGRPGGGRRRGPGWRWSAAPASRTCASTAASGCASARAARRSRTSSSTPAAPGGRVSAGCGGCAGPCSAAVIWTGYRGGPRLMSRLRKWWVMARNPQVRFEISEPVLPRARVQPPRPVRRHAARRPGGRVPARLPARARRGLLGGLDRRRHARSPTRS